MRVGSLDYTVQKSILPKKQGALAVPPFKGFNPHIFGRIHDLSVGNTSPQKIDSIETVPQSSGLDAKELFKYGVEALDNNTLFIVTNNRENSFFTLNRYKEKIDIPIFKTYILEVNEENSKVWHKEIDANFAIYKKNDEYYIMGLGSLFGVFAKDPIEERNSLLKPGEIRKLEPNSTIDIGISSNPNEEARLKFVIPEKFNSENADMFLEKKISLDTTGHNANAIAAITKKVSSKKDKIKKEFTFADIGGLDHVIEDLRKFVIRPINYPEVFENIRLNKGILLYGPPRCGKTLIGKALANEAGIDYKYMNASEFTKSTHGASEEKARDVFRELMEKPSILFIDEVESALHPQAISNFLDIIASIAFKMGIQVFIASHSYFVIKKLRLLAIKNKKSIKCISMVQDGTARVEDLLECMPENDIIAESVRLYEEEIDGVNFYE